MKTLSTAMLIIGTGLLIASVNSIPGLLASTLLIAYSTAICIKLEPSKRKKPPSCWSSKAAKEKHYTTKNIAKKGL